MYAKNANHVTFYKDNYKENTDKVVYGRVSEAIKTGRKTEDGKDEFVYETWDARFVGGAREKAAVLEDKTPITITEWSARANYNKEKKVSYPYLMVMAFEVQEKNNNK